MQESVSETLHLLFSQPTSFSPQVYIYMARFFAFFRSSFKCPLFSDRFPNYPIQKRKSPFLPIQTIPSSPFTLFFSTSTYHCNLMYYVFTYCLSSPRRMFKFQKAGICVCFVHCHTLSTQDSARHIGDQ